MVRSELIQKLTDENDHINGLKTEAAIDLFFEEIVRQLATGGRVEIREFGLFTARMRANREGRNPRTGKSIKVLPKNKTYFRASKGLAAAIQKTR